MRNGEPHSRGPGGRQPRVDALVGQPEVTMQSSRDRSPAPGNQSPGPLHSASPHVPQPLRHRQHLGPGGELAARRFLVFLDPRHECQLLRRVALYLRTFLIRILHRTPPFFMCLTRHERYRPEPHDWTVKTVVHISVHCIVCCAFPSYGLLTSQKLKLCLRCRVRVGLAQPDPIRFTQQISKGAEPS